MLDKNIVSYLEERKALWLKPRVKNKTEEEVGQLQIQANEDFSLNQWLPKAAKRAKQLFIVSHPAKFSHSSAKTSSIIANPKPYNDGLLRSGNAKVPLDVFGNAAALDVYKFLNIALDDNKNILQHLEENSDFIQHQLKTNEDYAEIRDNLLKIKSADADTVFTSSLVKQVYFPVGDDYHLLSLLTPSGLLSKFKNRINTINRSEENKLARKAKKKNEISEHKIKNIFNITKIGFGGTQPQNISSLNSQMYGEAYLLASMPPKLSIRNIKLPTKNFFSQTLWKNPFIDDFKFYHQILKDKRNNIQIRDKRDEVIVSILYKISNFMKAVRKFESGWSDSPHYGSLPPWQKVWLDNKHKRSRNNQNECLEELIKLSARWFVHAYREILAEESLEFDDTDLQHIIDVFSSSMEVLR